MKQNRKVLSLILVLAMFIGLMSSSTHKIQALIGYSVNIDGNIADGVVAADKTKDITKGETVTLTVTADSDFIFKSISVTTETETIETTEVVKGKTYTFKMPDSDVNVTAEFEKGSIAVLIDVGEGHESLFTEDALDLMRIYFGVKTATIEGNIIKLEGVNSNFSENDINEKIFYFYYEIDNTYLHNGEELFDVGYKSIDDYATYDEFDNDVYGDIRENTLISNNLKYYLLWLKPLENIEIDNGKPICGKDADSAIPVGPDGLKIKKLYWEDSNKNKVDVFEGDNEYTCYVDMNLPDNGALWKYFIDKDNVNINVVGGSDINILDDDDDYLVSFKTKVEHDWTYWSVVKEPTDTEDGLKERYCSICNKKETQVIPMNYSCGIELELDMLNCKLRKDIRVVQKKVLMKML